MNIQNVRKNSLAALCALFASCSSEPQRKDYTDITDLRFTYESMSVQVYDLHRRGKGKPPKGIYPSENETEKSLNAISYSEIELHTRVRSKIVFYADSLERDKNNDGLVDFYKIAIYCPDKEPAITYPGLPHRNITIGRCAVQSAEYIEKFTAFLAKELY